MGNIGVGKYKNSVGSLGNSDIEQFSKYSNVLKENAPKTLEEFKHIKYNEKEKWEQLKYEYRTVNRYEIEGDVPINTVLQLDNAAFYTKKQGFDFSSFTGRKKKNKINEIADGGNAATMLLDDKIYFSHSKFDVKDSLEYSLYKGKYEAVPLSKNRKFSVKDLGDGIPREYDTEAKFLEFVDTQKNTSETFTVTILSEKHICDSCSSVVEQFKEEYKNATVNIISGKRGYNNSPSGTKTWKHRKKVK